MELQSLLGRVGCILGRHGGKWEPAPDGPCAISRTCPYCGKGWADTRHSFTDWTYTVPDDTTSCVMARHCPRCELREEDLWHNPVERYLASDKCELQSSCARCGTPTSEVRVHHEDVEWQYLIEIDPPSGLAAAPMLGGFGRPYEACRGRPSCVRCGTVCGPIEAQHEWGKWRPEPQAQSRPAPEVRRCLRCGDTETKRQGRLAAPPVLWRHHGYAAGRRHSAAHWR
jgi:hypothetical protein